MTEGEARALLLRLFRAAIEAADPAQRVPPNLPQPPTGRTVVVGAGKAAAAMARAVEAHWPSSNPLAGLVITRHDHGVSCERIAVLEASHPLPDEAGEQGTRSILELIHGLTEEDLVLCLLSGGGSALLAQPAPSLTLDDKREVTRALLRSGATIVEINCVRSHLSAVKGGRLAVAAQPARVLTLAISDVPGDDPSVIASGPTTADPTTFSDARRILEKYRIEPPRAVSKHLEAARDETPKPGDPRLARASLRVIANARDALVAAQQTAVSQGLNPLVLGDDLQGEARVLGASHAQLAMRIARDRGPGQAPDIILCGGEATVTVRGAGRGGPNTEYALALALALDGAPRIYALAADTDGIDGTETNAGAVVGPRTLARARERDLDPRSFLDDNDSYGFFSDLGDVVTTGPTRTNVNDFRAILIDM